MLDLLWKYRDALLQGAGVTIELSLVVWLAGLVMGTALGVWRASRTGAAREILALVALMLGSVPILVYLLWAYYPLQASLGINLSPFLTAAIVLSLYNCIVVSDLVRGGIQDFPQALVLARWVNGVDPRRFRREILLPIVLRSALPAYLYSQVNALHLTLFASLISLDELFRTAQRINANEYRVVDAFSLIAVFYFAISFPLLLLARWIGRRLILPGMDR
jgi:His/Glu/Gln/Arg/opine family amino acid ABC transporter permease subunit